MIGHEAHPDLPASAAVAVTGAGSIAPDRSHWGFLLGLEAYRLGQPECPFQSGTVAAAQFRHGWDYAEAYAEECDRRNEVQFERNYCGAD